MGKDTLQKAIWSECCGSLTTWPESRITHEIQHVKDFSISSMCFSRGLFCGLVVLSQSQANGENHFFTDSSPNSHTQPLHKIPQKYRGMIEQNYNQIWHGIKANIYMVVNQNFTLFNLVSEINCSHVHAFDTCIRAHMSS